MHSWCDTRPAVTFLAAVNHRRMTEYRLVTEACVCERNMPKVVARQSTVIGLAASDVNLAGILQGDAGVDREGLMMARDGVWGR